MAGSRWPVIACVRRPNSGWALRATVRRGSYNCHHFVDRRTARRNACVGSWVAAEGLPANRQAAWAARSGGMRVLRRYVLLAPVLVAVAGVILVIGVPSVAFGDNDNGAFGAKLT